ncbi:MAG: sulfatase [Acidobacteria bacterium]|nr:sulfatase [Acidobacteriota bacterium]MCI0718293.1 sulfatase [Acidobacteriota bacterium]
MNIGPVKRRAPVIAASALLLAFVLPVVANARPSQKVGRLPNIIIILTDDQGYGDVGCFGARGLKTPSLDRMARTGMRFTNFYVSEPVCSASRASLLTGSYAVRVGLEGALNHTSTVGIHQHEVLLPELLKQRGYATALFGKWHLGHHPKFNPTRHGFDEYFGLPYPNDCTNKYHPVVRTFPPLPVMEGEKVVMEEPDQSQFTQWFTQRAIQFIERNKERPFFLYLAHVMPHVPIFASAKFRSKSRGGRYGDVIEELDWSVGEILTALRKQGLDEHTLVIFTSDNGPFLSYGSHAGSAGPLRGGKLTCFEGGVRVPCIMRWPGKIPAGVNCGELAATIDLLPTVARLAGAGLSPNVIDGKDIWPLLSAQKGARTPHQAYYFYAGTELQAIRSGDWKLHFPHPYLEVDGEPGTEGKPANFANLKPDSIQKSGLEGIATRHGYRVEHTGLELYHLTEDPGETRNLAVKHPQIVRQLEDLAEKARAELGDSLKNRKGTGIRPAGKL